MIIPVSVQAGVSTLAVFTLPILPDVHTVRDQLPVYTLRRVRPVHSNHIGRRAPSGGVVRSGRERYASAWRCSVNARVDASGHVSAANRAYKT